MRFKQKLKKFVEIEKTPKIIRGYFLVPGETIAGGLNYHRRLAPGVEFLRPIVGWFGWLEGLQLGIPKISEEEARYLGEQRMFSSLSKALRQAKLWVNSVGGNWAIMPLDIKNKKGAPLRRYFVWRKD